MTANKMPVLPEAVWIVLDTPGADFDWSFVRTEAEASEFDSDDIQPTRTHLYTADQMRAMWLAALEAARQAVPSYTRCEMTDHYNVGRNRGLSDTLANLSALEQGVGK